MKRYKFILVFTIMIGILMCVCGCYDTNKKTNKEISFSNIIEKKDVDLLSTLFKESNISQKNGDKILSSIKDYNDIIGVDLLNKDGIIDLSSAIPKYDDIKIDEMWLKKNDMFIGYNCRITAFQLMKDFITVEDISKSNESSIFMDLDALNYSKDNYFSKDEMNRFKAIYSTIETTSSKDFNEQFKIQKDYWDSIGVKFNENNKMSLISVYLHNHFSENENELIIGHTGILFNTEDGYIFFEKLSFQLPYQMIRFNSKKELKQYLMSSYDIDTTGECSKPFILENNHLLN